MQHWGYSHLEHGLASYHIDQSWWQFRWWSRWSGLCALPGRAHPLGVQGAKYQVRQTHWEETDGYWNLQTRKVVEWIRHSGESFWEVLAKSGLVLPVAESRRDKISVHNFYSYFNCILLLKDKIALLGWAAKTMYRSLSIRSPPSSPHTKHFIFIFKDGKQRPLNILLVI